MLLAPQDRIAFTFDHNLEIEHNAGELYQRLMMHPDPDEHEYKKSLEDKISFASKKEISIQAADLVARETMKILDNRIGPKDRHTRISARILEEQKRIRFKILDRQWC